MPRYHPLQYIVHSILLISLAIGAFFLFSNLDQKIFWFDEVCTAFRISGNFLTNTYMEINQGLQSGYMRAGTLIESYLRIKPGSTIIDVIKGCALEEPHPPLYFVLARIWAGFFSASAISLRLLSTLFGSLGIIAVYFLAKELFRSSLAGLIAAALFAISPFQMVYAHEARPYSLWILTMILAHWTFLRALRCPEKKIRWCTYTAVLACMPYVHLLSFPVFCVHAIYVLAERHFRLDPVVKKTAGCMFLSVILFAPWSVILMVRHDTLKKSVTWLYQGNWPFERLWAAWLFSVGGMWADLGGFFQGSTVEHVAVYGVIAIVGSSMCYVWRYCSRPAALFIISMIIIPLLSLVIPDLLQGSHRSAIIRYHAPAFLGVLLSLTFLIFRLIGNGHRSRFQNIAGVTVLLIFVTCGAASLYRNAQAVTWYNTDHAWSDKGLADIVNGSGKDVLLIVPDGIAVTNILALSQIVHKDTLMTQAKYFEISMNDPKIRTVMLVKPSQTLLDRFSQDPHFYLKQLSSSQPLLWQVHKKAE